MKFRIPRIRNIHEPFLLALQKTYKDILEQRTVTDVPMHPFAEEIFKQLSLQLK
jgi:hypothetical protein